jgi:UDP-4-amino-4,6-dideoxy-N-acetyl-beta-L-altrosamine transaminase
MIPYGKHFIDDQDIDAVVQVLKTGFLTQGPLVEEFEKAVALYTGAKYAVAVANGTAALHLAAIAAGAGPGNALITSPITFVASANAGRYAGARVVFADIDPKTINMSPESLEQALSSNPDAKVVVPVHFAGLPCDMESISRLARRFGTAVIEDAAHALGATYPTGEKVGSCVFSDMTIFSFHPVKAISAGEGGMITTNDERLYRHLLRLRSHGINKLDDPFLLPEQAYYDGVRDPWYYEMQELGYNYRITDIQCALALSQLKKLDRFVARRLELVRNYDAAFAFMQSCRPAQDSGRELSGHHLYVLRIDFQELGMNRGRLMEVLRDKGIGTQVHYIPVQSHPYYRNLGFKPEDCPHALHYYQECLSIPLYYTLSDQEQAFVISSIKGLLA